MPNIKEIDYAVMLCTARAFAFGETVFQMNPTKHRIKVTPLKLFKTYEYRSLAKERLSCITFLHVNPTF